MEPPNASSVSQAVRAAVSKPWFRMYAEFAHDPKVQLLAFEDQRHFLVLLCLKCDRTLDASATTEYRERMIAKALGLDAVTAAEVKRRLCDVALIAQDWQPIAWDRRQYTSDTSTERVHRHRLKKQREALLERSSNALEQTRPDQSRSTTAATRPTEPVEFLEIRGSYPKRAGAQPWRRALKAAKARIADGCAWQQLLSGTQRYRKFIESTGKAGTEFVMQAATFFGPDRHFLEVWTAPTGERAAAVDPDRKIRQYLSDYPQYRDQATTIAKLAGASVADVERVISGGA